MTTRHFWFGRLARLFIITAGVALSTITASAQTSSFTYQGRFTDGGTAANGTYDMQFKLYDGAGNQIGSTIMNVAVLVTNGVFTVQLDYGAAAFSGGDRFLELGVRTAGSGDAYTELSPRQQLSSTPYAIRAGSSSTADSATTAITASHADKATKADNATNADTAATATNATQLGGIGASQYVQTNDSRLADARPPTTGSANYIQNSANQQSASFNITGNGSAGGTLAANIVNATTQFNLNGTRILHSPGTDNLFAGASSGAGISTGQRNSFYGAQAGLATATGNDNAFFGNDAGKLNTGSINSVFGAGAGAGPITNGGNSFFGAKAGANGSSGAQNSFFGYQSGFSNTSGFNNTFVGAQAGFANLDGIANAFFGVGAGSTLTNGGSNTFIGTSAGGQSTSGFANTFVGTDAAYTFKSGNGNTALGTQSTVLDGLSNATAIGHFASVTQSNSLVLGSVNGVNQAQTDTDVGIGTTAPKARLHIGTNGGNILFGNAGCSSSFAGIGFGTSLTGCANYSFLGNGTDTIINRPTGGQIAFRENNTTQMSIAAGGAVSITTLGSAGSTSLCRNASNQISTCSSSLRYKKNIQPFTAGLSVLNRLRPITFDWKQGGMHDLGFGAEDIAAVEPLLVTHNDKGEVEGVKYDRISAVLVNAVKEQQEQIKRQQAEIESLKRLVCGRHRRASVCK